jgi:hypothetical protein
MRKRWEDELYGNEEERNKKNKSFFKLVAVVSNSYQLHQTRVGETSLEELHQNGESGPWIHQFCKSELRESRPFDYFFFRSGAVFGESGAAGAVANKSSINVIHLGLLYLLWCFSAET